jgi:CDP-diacylglycerol--serine O-phosphatidyltransferase
LKIKSHIPNAITLINLLVGVIGIIFVLRGDLLSGAYFILLSAFFDFIDGFAARALGVQGELGKQLDSLADVVSFGVLPGIILFTMTKGNSDSDITPYFTLIVPMISAYRLAKFNLDTRQSDQFIGLPTPANALLISTLPHLALEWPILGDFIQTPILLIMIAWFSSFLLIAEIPLIALKFKTFDFSKNIFRYILIAIALSLFIWLGLAGIPLIILVYIGLSVFENLKK